LTKEELPVEVCNVNVVKVDYVNVGNVGHGEVFEDFAAEASGANDQDSGGGEG